MKNITIALKKYLLIIIILILTANSFTYAYENIPLDSWIYEAIIKLEACGIISSHLFNHKPYSRYEVAFILSSALSGEKSMQNKDIQLILKKLEKEFYCELESINGNLSSDKKKLIIRKIDLFYLNVHDTANIYKKYEYLDCYFEFPAKKFFLSSKTEKGNNIWVKPDISFNYNDNAGIFLRPVIYLHEKDNLTSDNNEYILNLTYNNLDFIIGREAISWGTGQHGTLAVSENAPPREMLQIKNNSPFNLPWIFSKLGPVKFHVFFSRLEDEREVPDTNFSGLKINFLPSKRFEFGIIKTVLSGGSGEYQGERYKKPTALDMIADLIFLIPRERKGFEKIKKSTDTDQKGGFDFRIKIPELNCMLYTEYMQEDSRISLKEFFIHGEDDRASLVGAYFYVPSGDYLTDVNIEYASTTKPWYKHGKYIDGYTYKDKIMGHSMGPDANDLYISLKRLFTDKLSIEYSFNFERQGVQYEKIIEKKIEHNAGFTYDISARIKTNISYSVSRLENLNNIKQPPLNNYSSGINFSYIW